MPTKPTRKQRRAMRLANHIYVTQNKQQYVNDELEDMLRVKCKHRNQKLISSIYFRK